MYVDLDTDDIFMQYDSGQEGRWAMILFVASYNFSQRITKVYLICDTTADDPSITAEGDTAIPLTYVS